MEDGLNPTLAVTATNFFRYHTNRTPICKELVQHFVEVLSSKIEESSFSLILRYLHESLRLKQVKTRQLFSTLLNRSFVRILCCDKSNITELALTAYSEIVKQVTLEQRQLVADSEEWPVLITRLTHTSGSFVGAAGDVILSLVKNRDGEDYTRFIEEDLFTMLMKRFPLLPEQIVVEIPFTPNLLCRSKEFSALGWSWFYSLLSRLRLPLYTCSPVILHNQDSCYGTRKLLFTWTAHVVNRAAALRFSSLPFVSHSCSPSSCPSAGSIH
jgi:hypothetical protein